MTTRNFIRPNQYHDSIFLMSLARKLKDVAGVRRAAIVMGTPTNKALLQDDGLLCEEGRAAGPNDIIVAVDTAGAAPAEKVRALVGRLLEEKNARGTSARACRTLAAAQEQMADANLAVITLPGEFAVLEATKALERGLHVYMFSDDVSLEDEVRLKKLARRRGRLMMGPACGLSFLRQTVIGLGSKVRSGPIGLVGASGSGLQETMVIIDQVGSGVSQAIGTGGRDLRDEVGGLATLQAIDLLEADRDTRVIVLISKPPGPATVKRVLQRIRTCRKPVVVNFIGEARRTLRASGAQAAQTFEETALRAVSLAKGEIYQERPFSLSPREVQRLVRREAGGRAKGQRYLRGIFCGGTLAEEAMMVMRPTIGEVYSNAPLRPEMVLSDPRVSVQNSVIDIGSEEFTRGRPHAVIDPTPRLERFAREAADPAVAVILLDFLLGFGCHEDPTGAMAEPIAKARATARRRGRRLTVVASICGTGHDPQGLPGQRQKLLDAGVLVMPSNAQAARLAARIVAALPAQAKGDRR